MLYLDSMLREQGRTVLSGHLMEAAAPARRDSESALDNCEILAGTRYCCLSSVRKRWVGCAVRIGFREEAGPMCRATRKATLPVVLR